ncbi:enterotoxin, partial [Staphylococcus aureus]
YNQCYFSLDNMELNDGRLIEKNVYVWRCDRA